jgi:hypothetical protein
MPAVIFIALLDLGKKSSFVDRHYLIISGVGNLSTIAYGLLSGKVMG